MQSVTQLTGKVYQVHARCARLCAAAAAAAAMAIPALIGVLLPGRLDAQHEDGVRAAGVRVGARRAGRAALHAAPQQRQRVLGCGDCSLTSDRLPITRFECRDKAAQCIIRCGQE